MIYRLYGQRSDDSKHFVGRVGFFLLGGSIGAYLALWVIIQLFYTR